MPGTSAPGRFCRYRWVLSVRSIVRRRAGEQPIGAGLTASDLLARTDHLDGRPVGRGAVMIPAGMLADLHHPRLIITDDYVGPERRILHGQELHAKRRADRRPRTLRAKHPRPTAQDPKAGSLRTWHLVTTVAITAATVAPLTLVAAHLV